MDMVMQQRAHGVLSHIDTVGLNSLLQELLLATTALDEAACV